MPSPRAGSQPAEERLGTDERDVHPCLRQFLFHDGGKPLHALLTISEVIPDEQNGQLHGGLPRAVLALRQCRSEPGLQAGVHGM